MPDAFTARLDGRLDDALRGQTAILKKPRFLGYRDGERYATTNVAEIERLRGKPRRALELLRPFFEGADVNVTSMSACDTRAGGICLR